jgi:multicomponent Na+:H+ antiporter subunit D
VIIRIMFTVYTPKFSIGMLPTGTILMWVAAIAIIAGGIMALAQKDFKRMFTYVIVAEVGYIVLGIGMANKNGLTGAILHIVNDAFMMACLFLVIGAIYYKTGTRNIYEFRNLNKKMPWTMFAFIIVGLSVIGIPPTCGFFSKWYLLLGAIDGNHWLFAAALLFSSLIAAVLFFRVVENAFLNPQEGHHSSGHHEEEIVADEIPLSMMVPLMIIVVGIMTLGPLSSKIISSMIQYAIPAGF